MRHMPTLASGVALTIAALMIAVPACADIDPALHDQAKAAAAQVVLIDMDTVRTPRAPIGLCLIQARVAEVERGRGVRVGDALSVDVPCRDARAPPHDGAVPWQSSERMRTARRARIWLNAAGEMIPRRYLEIID